MGILKNLFSKQHKKEEPVEPKAPERKMISVLFPDGHTEEYPELLKITDGKYCVLCEGNEYHTHLDCKYLKWEREKNEIVRSFTIKEAREQDIHKCPECEDLDKLDKEWDKL